jgi:hypothetical protein
MQIELTYSYQLLTETPNSIIQPQYNHMRVCRGLSQPDDNERGIVVEENDTYVHTDSMKLWGAQVLNGKNSFCVVYSA